MSTGVRRLQGGFEYLVRAAQFRAAHQPRASNTMPKILLTIALIAPLAGFAVPASAAEQACTTEAASKWISQSDAKANATALGYTVRSTTIENNCYDVFALDKVGKHILAVMDPMTGKIVNTENESG